MEAVAEELARRHNSGHIFKALAKIWARQKHPSHHCRRPRPIAVAVRIADNAAQELEYPSVRVQLVPYSQGFLDKERQKPQVEVVAGVGTEAFFVPRVRQFAELYVRAGKPLLMLQASVPTGQTVDSIKPAVVNLAKALVAKLPAGSGPGLLAPH